MHLSNTSRPISIQNKITAANKNLTGDRFSELFFACKTILLTSICNAVKYQ